MSSTSFISTNEIRTQFTQSMSEMYQLEVPLYKKLLSLADNVNKQVTRDLSDFSTDETRLLKLEHHGAIRVGTADELSMIRRLFAVMGMYPVDYYDLSVAGIPVHSTAFRALDKSDLIDCPFRVFCSLLRLDLIDDELLAQQAKDLLNNREIFPDKLLKVIELSEKQGGLSLNQVNTFINNALEVFRWHQESTVEKHTYDALKASHGLVADVVSFKGPHINHLTPKVLDIDECQKQFSEKQIKAKTIVEGPPKRECPILLRQTSFIAIAEKIKFADGQSGKHTARFGEVEQRGIALTHKGRKLYDRLLGLAKNGDTEIDFSIRLDAAFKEFPDDYEQMRKQELAYFYYSPNKTSEVQSNTENQASNDIDVLIEYGLINITPIIYEDFLPVSAAGIFTSNLSSNLESETDIGSSQDQKTNIERFEQALGVKVFSSFELYEKLQQQSLNNALSALNINV